MDISCGKGSEYDQNILLEILKELMKTVFFLKDMCACVLYLPDLGQLLILYSSSRA